MTPDLPRDGGRFASESPALARRVRRDYALGALARRGAQSALARELGCTRQHVSLLVAGLRETWRGQWILDVEYETADGERRADVVHGGDPHVAAGILRAVGARDPDARLLVAARRLEYGAR